MFTFLSSPNDLLPGMILIFGLIAVVCILLFNIESAYRETKIVKKCNKSGKTEYYIYNVATSPNAIEFNTSDLLFKLAKEINPDSNVCLKISLKKQTLPGISSEVDPINHTWHVQITPNAPEDSSSDEESYVFTCEKTNDNCFLLTCTKQNKPTVQSFQDILWSLLETFCGTSLKRDGVRSTNTSRSRRTKRVAKTKPRRQQKRS